MRTIQFFSKLLFFFIFIAIFNSCKDDIVDPPIINSKPTVKILSPSPDEIILESTLIVISAKDDNEVTSVELFIDGKTDSSKIFFEEPYQYLWNTENYSDSSKHSIFAVAYDNDGDSTKSEIINVMNYTFSPSNLNTELISDTLITLTWHDNSKVETGYEVELSEGNNFNHILTAPANSNSANIIRPFYSNNPYIFRVRAVADSVKSKFTNTDTVYFGFEAPADLNILSFTDELLQLKWEDKTDFENGFEIEISEDGSEFKPYRTASNNIVSFAITDTFNINVNYQFRVRAVSEYNFSEYSNVVSKLLALPPPGGLTATSISDNEIKLDWTDNSDFEKGFIVERKLNDDNFSLIDSLPPNTISWNDTALALSNDYTYRINTFSKYNYVINNDSLKLSYDTDTSPIKIVSDYTNYFRGAKFSPDGKIIASYSRYLILWEFSSMRKIKVTDPHNEYLNAVAFSPDGNYLATAAQNGEIKVWTFPDLFLVNTFTESKPIIEDICFSPDGKYLASCTMNLPIHLWNIENGTIEKTYGVYNNFPTSVIFSPDGNYIFSGNGQSSARVYNAETTELIWHLTGHFDSVTGIDYDEKSNLIATSSLDGCVILWNMNTGSSVKILAESSGYLTGVDISPDGKTVIAGSYDRNLYQWEISSGSLYRRMDSHTNNVQGCSFSNSGKYILTVCSDPKLRVFNAAGKWMKN
ncbi:MAG: hypothetical protein HND52_18010 [Ignavibacteriae bacterium]|nr:hypothetical protein [Ignavibacteriota bacterium]NOG99859.1 hypothetical protein [Ignavibacteriota bacterium]